MAEGQYEAQKKRAAIAALALVKSGMTLGLGSGSTFAYVLDALANRLSSGELKEIRGIPSSEATAARAQELGIPVIPLTGDIYLDLTIDGADEIDGNHHLIKGGGGALLREKLIAEASARLVIVTDSSKKVACLGNYPLPVEVLPFGWQRQKDFLADLGAEVMLRKGNQSQPYFTDNGNYILDCQFGCIEDPASLATTLKSRTGIIEHGLFINLTTDFFVASDTGVESWHRND